MEHAHHFLSRLDRVSNAHVELALSLYNDTELLLFILERVAVPESVPRVAISMHDPRLGPFLVVTRDGYFVTCLGEGMSPGDLPVVTRGQLDGLAAKFGQLRVRMKLADKLESEHPNSDTLMQRVYNAGQELSREEFMAVSSWHPMMARMWLVHAVRLQEHIDRLIPFASFLTRPTPKNEEVLHKLWTMVWCVGHLTALAASDAKVLIDGLPEGTEQIAQALAWLSLRHRTGGLVARGFFWMSKAGKHLLPYLKGRFDTARHPVNLLEAIGGLTAIGLRHARLAAEARKASAVHPFDALPPLGIEAESAGGKPDHDIAARHVLTLFRQMAGECFDEPETAASVHREVGQAVCVELAKRTREGSPYHFTERADVPDALAMTMAVNLEWDVISSENGLLLPIYTLPWLAKASAEELYLPRDYLRAVRFKWDPSDTKTLLEAHRVGPTVKEPVRAERLPGRNDPCSCGSGKKYKKCHGA